MNGKVKIEVFGIARDPKTGGNSIQLKMYFSLVKYLNSSDVVSQVDLRFIDTAESAMKDYPAAQSALQKGIPTPLVSINGAIKYSGSIPYEAVYQNIKSIIASK